jgi:hypothetical protein
MCAFILENILTPSLRINFEAIFWKKYFKGGKVKRGKSCIREGEKYYMEKGGI